MERMHLKSLEFHNNRLFNLYTKYYIFVIVEWIFKLYVAYLAERDQFSIK